MEKIITDDNWPIVDMPETFVETLLDRKLSDAEYQVLLNGFRSKETDDRWFMYVRTGWLYMHRNWTGICIFKVKIEATKNGYELGWLQINRDYSQYKSTNIEADKNELNSVLNSFLALHFKK